MSIRGTAQRFSARRNMVRKMLAFAVAPGRPRPAAIDRILEEDRSAPA